jgi:hypothetical protein
MSAKPTDSVPKTSSSHLNRQIAQYSAAAAVAGVSLLALASPASGEVVFTKKTIHIPLATDGSLEPIKISMANNGIDNFNFTLSSTALSVYRFLLVGGSSLQDGLRVGTGPAFNVYLGALRRGERIGPSNPSSLFNEGLVEESLSNGPNNRIFFGSWGGSPKNRYLGVRFPINGQLHYGWIRLTVTTNPDPHTPVMSATITGYAYETVPNKAISAGTAAMAASAAEKPTAEVQVPKNIQNQSGPALGMLALGSQALALWRREDTLISN